MLEPYLRARRIVALAAFAVLLASGFIVTAFYRQLAVPCRGVLVEVPLSDLPAPERRTNRPGGNGVQLDYERQTSRDPNLEFKDVRVVMNAPEGTCACKGQLSLHWDPRNNPLHQQSPLQLDIYQNVETGTYVVHRRHGNDDVFAFRRADTPGHVFQWRRALEPRNVSMLILLGAIGSLLGAGVLIARAGSYVLTMSSWRPAKRRDDGLLEDANGAAIARLGRVSFRESDVIVNPKQLDGRAVYRELPLLDRRDVAPGSHERWTAGTYRRFRDARMLAVLATLTTALSVGAHFVAR